MKYDEFITQLKTIHATDVNDAYKKANNFVLKNYEYELKSRIGPTLESTGLIINIERVEDYFVSLPNSTRIDKEYAETFWNFMISGGTDAEEVYKAYPNVAQFITKPKSDILLDNFNTFYGPRILEQLPAILKELRNNPNSRRAVIQILKQEDQLLLDTNETLEYPCCDSITLYIRDGKLNSHVHMRSENIGIVFKLDMYLQGKFLQFVANELNIDYNKLIFSIVSAHIYEKDVDYIRNVIYG